MEIKEKTAAALGFFDGLHMGHKAVISCASEAGKRLGIPLSVMTFAGEPDLPKFDGRKDMCLMPYEEKKEMLKLCGARYIVAYDFAKIKGMPPAKFFKKTILGDMNAAYVVCGEDFRFGKGGSGDAVLLGKLCEDYGIDFEIVPAYKIDGVTVSSSYIRELIREGDVEKAMKMLGHTLSYTLTVHHGKTIGHAMGFPTINQRIPEYMVRPKYGVYASRVIVDGQPYHAMTDIGVKPTVVSDTNETMETHIIGFDGDLYGEKIKVELIKFIREEKRFDGLSALKEQLSADMETVQSYFESIS